jgi:Family of unknown function (DUF6790)
MSLAPVGGPVVAMDATLTTTSASSPVATGSPVAVDVRARRHRRIGAVLRWFLVIGVGVWGLVNFFLHTVRADETARQIGWPTGNPFQSEVAVTSLALAVLGLLCFFVASRGFWTATVISLSVFYLGAAVGHIHEMVAHGNFEPGNAGFPFVLDIALPVVLIGLLIADRATAPQTDTLR